MCGNFGRGVLLLEDDEGMLMGEGVLLTNNSSTSGVCEGERVLDLEWVSPLSFEC